MTSRAAVFVVVEVTDISHDIEKQELSSSGCLLLTGYDNGVEFVTDVGKLLSSNNWGPQINVLQVIFGLLFKGYEAERDICCAQNIYRSACIFMCGKTYLINYVNKIDVKY